MKYFLIALIAIALGFGAAKVVTMLSVPSQVAEEKTMMPSGSAPVTPVAEEPAGQMVSENPTIDNNAVTVAFTGIGGGNTYDGSFQNVESNLVLLGGVVAGTVAVDTGSVTTAAAAATENWKSKSSFYAASYPTASFSFASWKKETDTVITATGKLTIRNITKQITVPVTYENGVYTAQFAVKASELGFTNKLISELTFIVTVPTK